MTPWMTARSRGCSRDRRSSLPLGSWMTPLELARDGVLGHRRRVSLLDRRVPWSDDAVQQAAWAGLTDSMPRAALSSLHARLAEVEPDALDDEELVQVWGPRYSVYVVHEDDVAVFTRGRLPPGGRSRRRADDIASRLSEFLDGDVGDVRAAGAALGVHHNAIRYAAPTGTVRISWDGARQPEIWSVSVPDVDDHEMRCELARRHLHVAGPATPASYSKWAGLPRSVAETVFDALDQELIAVTSPIGHGRILAADEASFRAPSDTPAPARLLPSGDAYWLCWGDDRDLLVDDPRHRDLLWTPRVWPGAVMVGGEIVGTWRRSQHEVTIQPWHDLSVDARDAVVSEATTLPLPGPDRPVEVHWAPLA